MKTTIKNQKGKKEEVKVKKGSSFAAIVGKKFNVLVGAEEKGVVLQVWDENADPAVDDPTVSLVLVKNGDDQVSQ
jgi:hypothetical protein